MALVTVLQKVADYMNEAAFVAVGLVGRALHEQPPVRVALRGVGRVRFLDLPEIVQKGRKLYKQNDVR